MSKSIDALFRLEGSVEVMRILTFTSLYPNNMQPDHGLFVEHRLANLLRYRTDYEARVLAPVPWFPVALRRLGKYGKYASVNTREIRRGIEIFHPRYPVLPKIGMTIAPLLLATSCLRPLRRIIANGWDFDLIDAHYFYPDGVAAIILGRAFRKPVVITARGTDINLLPRFRLPRLQINWAITNSDAMITVCDALRSRLIELGAAPDKVKSLRNGVDLALFRPLCKRMARKRLKLNPDGQVLLTVGHLVERKGHHLVIKALASLGDKITLLVVGDGEMRDDLKRVAEDKGVSDRVRFCGSVSQSDLPWYYSAADALVLASSREGMANVLLESLACGTPAVATNVWGTPEVIIDGLSGCLVQRRTAEEIALGVERIIAGDFATEQIRRFAEKMSWDATSRGQVETFGDAILSHAGRA